MDQKMKDDTPETNANAGHICYVGEFSGPTNIGEVVRSDFARKLERERDEARQIAECINRGLFSSRYFRAKLLPWQKSDSFYCTCGNPSQHITGWNSDLCYDCRKTIQGLQK